MIAPVGFPMWRDPWMDIASSTFTGDLVPWVGYANVDAHHSGRYPNGRRRGVAVISTSRDIVRRARAIEEHPRGLHWPRSTVMQRRQVLQTPRA